MRFIGGRNAAIERQQQQNLLNFFGLQPFFSAPLRWTLNSLGWPAAAIIATMTSDLVAGGSAGVARHRHTHRH